MKMKITNCRAEQLKECSTLLVQVYSNPEYAETWKDKDAYDYLERFYIIEPSGCFVASVNNELAGAIFSYSYPWQSEKMIYIQELFVSIEQRKKGIAKVLMQNLSKDNTVKAWLVANENSTASGFYKKLGFRKDSLYKFNYGEIE